MMKIFLILFAVFLCLEYATLPVLAVTRVALVSTYGEKAENHVLELTEVLLGKQPDIALVERREVEKVLNEQKLMLSGLGDSDKAMAIGKLLGVEVFAVLEIFPSSKEALGLLVFDAGNGVKLLDMSLPADEIEKTAKIVVTGVSKACAKRRQPALQRKTVCLLSVRNAELPREMDGFCAGLGMLLERALLDSPGIVVLERNRLELVNRERSLPVAEELKDLWSSVVVVESDVRRAADGRDLWVVCHLSNVTGQDIGTVDATASQTNADSLARELASRLTESLHVVPVGAKSKPIIEASRFYDEAQFLHSHGDQSAAIDHMYAACMLAPTNKAFRAELNSFIIEDAYSQIEKATSLFTRRYPDLINSSTKQSERAKKELLLSPKLREQLTKKKERHLIEEREGLTKGRELLTKALDKVCPALVEQHVENNRWLCDNTNSFEISDPSAAPRNRSDMLISLFRRIYDNGDESQQSRIRTIIGEHYDDIVGRMEIALRRTGGTGRNYQLLIQRNTSVCLDWLRIIRDWPLNSDDYHRRFVKIATAWLKMTENIYYGESTAEKYKWNPGSAYILENLIWSECMETNTVMNEASTRIGDAMARNPYPLIRLYGLAIELHNTLRSDCLPPDIAQQQRIEFKESALNILPTKPAATWYNMSIYNDAGFLFQKLFPDTNELYEAQIELCDMALSSHVIYDGLQDLINKEPDPANKLKWIERVLAVNALADSRDGRNRRDMVANEFKELRNKVLGISTPTPLVSAEPPTSPPPTSSCLPWAEVQRVFDVTSVAGLTSFDFPVLDGEAIYVLGHGMDSGLPCIKLLKIYLPDGDVQQCGIIKQPFGNVQAVCLGNGHFYVATDQGVFDLPLGPGEIHVINCNNGLPSPCVYSIAYLEGRLYAGLGGDGYIISYDLASNRSLVLASSRRREQLSPLDNGPSFQTYHMLADPRGNRVLFRNRGQQEIWQINQEGAISLYAKISKYSPHDPKQYSKQYMDSPLRQDEQGVFIFGKDNLALVYNLLDDPYEIMGVHGGRYNGVWINFVPRINRVIGKLLWIASPFGRMNLEDNLVQRDLFPGLAYEGVGVGFNPAQCIFPFNNGKQLLLGDDKTLWLVDLRID